MPLDPTRDQRVTASMVPWLMAGHVQMIQRFFLRAIGDPRFEDDGFSESWLSRFGMLVEPLALDFHAEKTGSEFVDRGTQYFHPARAYVSATLDARRISITNADKVRVRDNCVMDVKCINAYRSIEEVCGFYAGQLVVQEECANAERCALLIVRGGAEPIECPIDIDEQYRQAVWATIDRFWDCVLSLTPPLPLYFPRIVPPEQWRTIDLDNDIELPNWAADMQEKLTAWGNSEQAAKFHDEQKTEIKKLFPDDCGKLLWQGFSVSRNRANAVTIKSR